MRPKKIFIQEDSLNCLCHYDTSCVALVTKNEKEKSIEYTDLSQVWHKSKEEPEKGRSIISIGTTGVSAYKWVDEWRCDWLDFAEWSELFRWAYVYDLLPKGGKL